MLIYIFPYVKTIGLNKINIKLKKKNDYGNGLCLLLFYKYYRYV